MFKRLAQPTGEITETPKAHADDSPDRIVRSAILVHSGPDGKASTLQSSDGDITFDEDRIRDVVESHNAMIGRLAVQYGGFDKMPVGAFPPILDQHADDSNDRIRGRLTGLLRFENRAVPKVGGNVACAVADITFLGRETVEKVVDGRIFHLSVGIDEDSNTLGEVSTVIEPAAAGAMVLKKRKTNGVKPMNVKLAKLKALKEELKQLGKKADDGNKRITLAKRKIEVASRFKKLMSDKKMSPAEFKKVDLVRLAKLGKDDLESVLHVYEGREELIRAGQIGSTSAATFTDVGTSEEREMKRLKSAVKKSMKLSGTKFKDEDEGDGKKELALADDEKEKDDKKELAEGDEAEVESSDADQKDVSDVIKMVEENSAQIARVASLVDGIIDELQGDDESEDDEPKKEDPDEAKELSKEEDDDKKDKDDEEKKEKGDK